MSEANREQLPPGWSTALLSDVSAIVMGQSPPSSTYNTEGGGLPFFQGKSEFGDLYPEPRVWCSVPGKIAESDDILLCVRAPVGPTNLAPAKCCIGRGLAAIRPESGINLKYLLHVFRRFASELDAKGTGTTFKAVSGKVVREFLLPLSPTAEQNRIADALDELFSDLDAGVAALERVRDKLKLYRASVLKAAVEGVLTAEWRAQHPHAESASELLKRILAERCRRWENDQLAKFKAKRQEPPKDWKTKYKEPGGPNTNGLPSLPQGWCWVTLSQAAWSAGYGTSEKCRETNTGLAVLRIPNIVGGRLAMNELKFAPPDYFEQDEDLVVVGDLLVVRTNGSRNLIGRGAVVRDEQTRRLSFASYLIRFRLVPDPSFLRWISLLWDTVHVRHWIETRAATSAGQYNISLGILESLVVPIPPPSEQEAIVEAVEDQLSVIDHLETDLDSKLKSAQGLRQAILRYAFTGQLVPRDPNDEPASELLKRITTEREARERHAQKRPKKIKVGTS